MIIQVWESNLDWDSRRLRSNYISKIQFLSMLPMKITLCRSGLILFLLLLLFIISKASISQKIVFISAQIHSSEKGQEK